MVLIVVTIKCAIFLNVTSYSVLEVHQHFVGTQYPIFKVKVRNQQADGPEYGNIMFLQNISKLLPDYIASHRRINI